MTSLGKSFRMGNDKDVINFDSDYCYIKNSYTDDQRDMEVGMRIFRDRRAKVVEQNKVKIRKTSEMVGGFKVVLFCPEQLSLIKGGPAERRQFLDIAISAREPVYLGALQRYAQILKQRNALIRAAEKESE